MDTNFPSSNPMSGPPPIPPRAFAPRPPRRSTFRRMLSLVGCLVFVGSLVLNVYLAILVAVRFVAPGMDTDVLRDGDSDQVVAVYAVEGLIDEEAAQTFATFTHQVSRDDNVRAVVLRVESPGGTISASESIRHRVLELKAAGKSVVVSMGGLAASGGYYISAPADEIFAEPSTLTGSIGVLAVIPNVKGTLDKIGMKVIVLKSRHAEGWKDMLSAYRTHDRRERDYLVGLLDQMQARFEQIVRQGRGEKLVTKQETYTTTVGTGSDAKQVTKKVTAPFNGKVYLAEDAQTYGLVDEIGFLDDAARKAATLAGLDRPKTVRYRSSPKLLSWLMDARAASLTVSAKTIHEIQSPQILMLWKPEW